MIHRLRRFEGFPEGFGCNSFLNPFNLYNLWINSDFVYLRGLFFLALDLLPGGVVGDLLPAVFIVETFDEAPF